MRTPDWMVERIAQGDLAPAELEAARRRLLAEPDGAERLAALEASNAEILAAHPPAQVAQEVARRAHLSNTRARVAQDAALRPSARWRSLAFAAPLAVGLAVLMVLVMAKEDTLPTRTQPEVALVDGNRSKGLGPTLVLHRREAGAVHPLANGAAAGAGDLLQLGYVSAGRAFGLILSIDGAGAVTVHLPEGGAQSVRLEGPFAQALEHAYELDDAPGFERFFFITSDRPFDAPAVLSAARALGEEPLRARTQPLPLPEGLDQSSFLLVKDAP